MLPVPTVNAALDAASDVTRQMPIQHLKEDVFDIVLNALLEEAGKHRVLGWSVAEIAAIVPQLGVCYELVARHVDPQVHPKEFQTIYRTVLKKIMENWVQDRDKMRL